MRAVLLAAALLLALPAPARGAPGSQELVDRLRELIRRAERTRAADRWFLDELRALTRRYDLPLGRPIVRDDFGDGDFTRSPAWFVGAGRFAADRDLGLLTAVRPAQAPPREERGGGGGNDLAGILLESILEKQLGKRRGGGFGAGDLAELYLRRPIPNAFALRVDFVSRSRPGRLEFAFFEGSKRTGGYRLAYNPGGARGVELLRGSRFGASVIGAYGRALYLEDHRVHTLEWTRDASGGMVVRLDGREVLRAWDREKRGVFDGFSLLNRGGEYAIREIAIYALR